MSLTTTIVTSRCRSSGVSWFVCSAAQLALRALVSATTKLMIDSSGKKS